MHFPSHPKSKLFFIFQFIPLTLGFTSPRNCDAASPVPIQPGVGIPPFPF